MADRFTHALKAEGATWRMVIDVTDANFLDISGLGALDKIVARLRRDGCMVEVVGYDQASADLIDRFALH